MNRSRPLSDVIVAMAVAADGAQSTPNSTPIPRRNTAITIAAKDQK
jgi:hypothetical protein